MSETPSASVRKSLLLTFVVLLAGAGVVYAIFTTEPEVKRSGATKKTAMLVETIELEFGSFEPTISVTGTVKADREVSVSPLVSGAVVSRSDAFSPGRFVQKGSVLFQIDPANYRIALSQAKSSLAQAKTTLLLELGQQDVARQEYQALFQRDPSDTELSEEEKRLVLRQPQLAAAQERVSSAESAVEQARLNLNRTTVRAPFDAHVIERTVDIGAHVQPGSSLGRLVGVERYWVEASIPLGQRRWLRFSEEEGKECSQVVIANNTTWKDGVTRTGCLARWVGALDPNTRLARVLVSVRDPLARSPENEGAPPLIIDEYVEARIMGTPLQDVVRVPREFMRKGDSVWIARDDRLSIEQPEVLLFDTNYAYVEKGLTGGELLITSNLSSVTDGAALRFEAAAHKEASKEPEP